MLKSFTKSRCLHVRNRLLVIERDLFMILTKKPCTVRYNTIKGIHFMYLSSSKVCERRVRNRAPQKTQSEFQLTKNETLLHSLLTKGRRAFNRSATISINRFQKPHFV